MDIELLGQPTKLDKVKSSTCLALYQYGAMRIGMRASAKQTRTPELVVIFGPAAEGDGRPVPFPKSIEVLEYEHVVEFGTARIVPSFQWGDFTAEIPRTNMAGRLSVMNGRAFLWLGDGERLDLATGEVMRVQMIEHAIWFSRWSVEIDCRGEPFELYRYDPARAVIAAKSAA